jgi:hypothetical protein
MIEKERPKLWERLFGRRAKSDASPTGKTSSVRSSYGQPASRAITQQSVQIEADAFRRRLSASTKVVQQPEDPPIEIDPRSITFGFGVLGSEHSSKLSNMDATQVLHLNCRYEPKLFPPGQSVTLDAGSFVAPTVDGWPDVTAIPGILEHIGKKGFGGGLEYSYSVVIHPVVVSLDQSKSEMNALVGFAFRDDNPRNIFPRTGGCIPKHPAINTLGIVIFCDDQKSLAVSDDMLQVLEEMTGRSLQKPGRSSPH